MRKSQESKQKILLATCLASAAGFITDVWYYYTDEWVVRSAEPTRDELTRTYV